MEVLRVTMNLLLYHEVNPEGQQLKSANKIATLPVALALDRALSRVIPNDHF